MSILATDKKLISFGTDYSAGSGISIIDHTISIVPSAVGKTYSAGPNIEIYDVSGQPTISSKDWSSDIANASANAYTQSTSYFNEWINGQYTGDITNITNNITALSGDLSGYYKKTETSSKEQINDALQYVSANAGKVYEGISPIVVNNDSNKISADTWTLSAGDGISFTDDSANKVTRIDVTAQGGGGSVSSKYGTISVDGSNIEATNKAIEFIPYGVTSSFGTDFVNDSHPVVYTWDNYSQETRIYVNSNINTDQSGTLTYSSNTNVTGEVTAENFSTTTFNLQIPNATSIRLSSDKIFTISTADVTIPNSSFKVSELAWKSDVPTYTYTNNKVSAINGSALVGNEDYLVEQGFVQNLTSPKGTVSVLNNNKIEGTNSAIASDVIEGFVSSYNAVSVYPEHSATLTWDRYVPNTMLFVSGTEYHEHTLTYSANTDVTGVITTTTAGQISVELPTDSTSIVIGNEDWSITAYNFTVSADDNYEIGELAWASALPTFEYDTSNKISAINGSALAGGSDVPSGTMNVSGLEYNAVNEISAYNGSAIAQYGAEKQWLQHDDTLVHVSNSAQYALGVNLSAVAQLLGVDETVLFSGSTQSPSLTDSIWNYKKILLLIGDDTTNTKVSNSQMYYTDDIAVVGSGFSIFQTCKRNGGGYVSMGAYINVNNGGFGFTVESVGGWASWDNSACNYRGTGTWSPRFYKVIGIGRKQ